LNGREKFGPKRVAILDTDRHHGNGTRDIFLEDEDILHVCFCHWNRIEGDGNKICVNAAFPITDDGYLEKVKKEFMPRAEAFRPDMILHNLGHDTCQLDYGDIGLTEAFFPRLVRKVKACAEKVCGGKYVILTHGGRRADVAETIFPQIAGILAGD
jgi:acetoin utilization deacetylase AcuC-like enzyme